MSRRLLILAAITGALAALTAIDPTPPAPAPITFALPMTTQMAVIEVQRPNQPTVRLERRGTAWFVGQAPVDRHVQTQLLEAFALPTPMDARVRDTDPAPYGVTDQALTVRLGDVTVRVGKVVDGRQTFIRTADGVIYRARANLRQIFDRPPHTWPERRVFSGTGADVYAIELRQAGRRRWAIALANATWRLADPNGGPADPEQAASLAHMLATLRAERFIEPAAFAPRLTVVLRHGATDYTLEIGPLEGQTARARVVGQAGMFRIARSVVELLDLPREALRDRRVYVGDPAQVTAIEIGGARAERDSPGWRGDLLTLRALSLPARAPDAAFAQPERALTVWRGAVAWTLELGAPFGQGARWARTSDGRTLVLGPATLRELSPPVLDDP